MGRPQGRDAVYGRRKKLSFAIRKYGASGFVIQEIAQARTVDDLFELERLLIAQEDSFRCGYNMTAGGEGPAGLVHSADARARMRQSHLGKRNTPEAIAKTAAANRGRKQPPRSDEWRANHSAAMTGRKWTDEQRELIVAKLTGRQFTDEWRAKISAAKKGQGPSPEQARAHSEKMRGRKQPPRTPEHCARLAEAVRRSWSARRAAKQAT
jgi:hypothetical protein